MSRRVFTLDFKRSCVILALSGTQGDTKVLAKKLGILKASLDYWITQYNNGQLEESNAIAFKRSKVSP